jgi:hypothetical protein
MRRLSIPILLSAAFLVAAAVVPVAAVSKQPTGNRINLFAGDQQSYPASTAFHIRDGWLFLDPTTIDAIGKYTFTLDVDGTPRTPDFKTSETGSDGSLLKLWWFNFPAGMTGTHAFVGHFLGPCGSSYPCNGQPPNTVVEQHRLTVTVTFI